MKTRAVPIEFSRNRKIRRTLLANRTGAVIYREGRQGQLIFMKRLTHPEGSLTEAALDSDKPGRGVSSAGEGSIHHALDRKSHRHEESARRFAAEISRSLKQLRLQDPYEELVLVAEPHFLGLLRAALPHAIRSLVRLEIPREYARGSDRVVGKLIQQAANRV